VNHSWRIEGRRTIPHRRSGRRKKDRGGKSRELERRRVEDIIGKGPPLAERMPVMPQTALLRPDLSPVFEG
jgi:hypothetical protein